MTASVSQRDKVCNTSFQCYGKDVAVISRFNDSKSSLTSTEAHKTSFHISALPV